MRAVFIDTNILLHFTTFDELPLDSLVHGEFKLVFPPIILDELDKHKNHNNPKTAKRARMLAGKLIAILNEQEGRFPSVILHRRPVASTFEQNSLDPKHQDDCLLASIIEYRKNNESEQVLLITDDLMASVRSKTFNIPVLKLDSKLRLKDNQDEQTKLIEKLKQENANLKESIPKVDLFFADKTRLLRVPVKSKLRPRDEIVEEKMAEIEKEHPLMIIEAYKEPTTLAEKLALLNRLELSNKTKARFNDDLTKFFQEHKLYLNKYFDFAVKRFMAVELEFAIINSGNLPAEDIDVWIHLPDGFEAFNAPSKAPKEPKPPHRPEHDYDTGGNNFLSLINLPKFHAPRIPVIDFDAPHIRKTNSYEVTYHCKLLKHQMTKTFDKVYLQYESFECMKNFTIDYRLNISNVPKLIEGTLNVVFEQEE
ncbi:PIN domain-containing protein [Mucilaginibacter daejeonensis]|uniref:PIN domain-containing protein n=1 Tax=Mucilaginibacter daejeonensis TaxID=398049 RepID=UPI001D17A910|nr:PIN domain-containing protein [Mucilaginibacter daejeonensis]UEG54038.1 PIN domain-containing protein [Mucilaginibacter daejeonensis]